MNIWKSYILMKISNKQLNNLAVRRVLVLIQVDSLRSSKPSTRHKLNLVAKKRKCWRSIHASAFCFFVFFSIFF